MPREDFIGLFHSRYWYKSLGDVNSTRAVGNANGKNPVSIIVPCHRVIGANGNLVGYSGGLSVKRSLLLFEKEQTEYMLFSLY